MTTEHFFYLLLILLMIYVVAEHITLTSGAIIMGIFTLFWFVDTSRYKADKEKKPLVYTPRMKRLGLLIVIPLAALWFVLFDFGHTILSMRDFAAPSVHIDPYFMGFSLVVVDILIPGFLFIAAWILKPVERMIQNGFKKQARQKLASLSHLKVIAITGSYGKTSTKFMIDAFLKERINVCVTPGSYNTPMGICKVINNDLDAAHQVLILEMGARYEGNIKELCNIAKPDMAVITNVGISHLETFGSIEVIAMEKSTLARELKRGGTLILNGDDPRVKQMASLRHNVKTVLTGMDGQVQAFQIETGPEGTSFLMRWLDDDGTVAEEEQINTRLLGSHNIQNLLLGAAVAREFGIRLKTVALAASKLEPVEHRLQLKNKNGITVIDDAFNSNPVGAKNAVDVLDSFKEGRKIIITPGMIELGEMEALENEKFGKHIGNSGIDLVILVGADRAKPIERGIRSSEHGRSMEVKIVSSLFEANDVLTGYAQPGDVVLYENDLPDTYNG